MRKTLRYGILILCFAWTLTGCAVFNPYNDEFQCPDVDKGECTSMQNAYKKSISPLERKDKCGDCVKDRKDKTVTKKETKETTEDIRYNYQNNLYNKMTALIQNPQSPMVAAPDVMRVLIMSYTGPENILYSYRYVYVFVTEPKWIYSTTQIK